MNGAGEVMSPLLSWLLIVLTVLLSVGVLWITARLLIALLSLD